jgi:hypothetical protein
MTSHLSLALVASTALLLPACASTQRAAAHAGSAEPIAVIRLEPWRTRWAVTAVVGGAPRRYLLDTGGGLSFVSAGTAAAAGCRPWGRLTGFNMFGRRGDTPRCDGVAFDIGGRRYTPAATGLTDMAKLNPRDSALDGLVALDMFADRAVTLDLAAGRIVVESEGSLAERVGGMTPLPIRVNREASGFTISVLAAVPSERGTLWMELDSGNGGTILVSKPVASLLGLDSAVAGKQRADFAVSPGVRVRSDDAYTPDMTMDGNLGMPFLRHWLVTLDLRTQRAWIAPAILPAAAPAILPAASPAAQAVAGRH